MAKDGAAQWSRTVLPYQYSSAAPVWAAGVGGGAAVEEEQREADRHTGGPQQREGPREDADPVVSFAVALDRIVREEEAPAHARGVVVAKFLAGECEEDV